MLCCRSLKAEFKHDNRNSIKIRTPLPATTLIHLHPHEEDGTHPSLPVRFEATIIQTCQKKKNKKPDSYILEEFVTLRLAGKNDVAAFVLELEQDFCQVVVELSSEKQKGGQK